jgi:hypothetical protein
VINLPTYVEKKWTQENADYLSRMWLKQRRKKEREQRLNDADDDSDDDDFHTGGLSPEQITADPWKNIKK